MATIKARRRPIRDSVVRSNERKLPHLAGPSARAERGFREKTRARDMAPPGRGVEAIAKIATHESSGPGVAVDLSPRMSRRRSNFLPEIRDKRLSGRESERLREAPGVIAPDLGIDDTGRPLA